MKVFLMERESLRHSRIQDSVFTGCARGPILAAFLQKIY